MKQSGLGWTTCDVDDATGTPQDVRNDLTNLQFSTPKATQDVTGIDKSAMERILLLADFSITLNGVFNPDAGKGHSVFRTVPSTSVPRTTKLTVAGQTLINECLYTDYPLTRADSGELTYAVPGVLCDGTVPTWTAA
ncbi:hypothetical protein [Streptomyces tremellae]|uniref:Uncharacterized protein n=1 Tax=Streptomyces tremellae TaxID=1124239 RepID=A0ABP7EGR3_9ACTN